MKNHIVNAASIFFFIIGMVALWMILAIPFISISVAVGAAVGDFFDPVHLGTGAMIVATATSLIILFGVSAVVGGMMAMLICSQISKVFVGSKKH